MSREKTNEEIIDDLVKIGLVSTAVSIPVGLWAFRKWPDSMGKTALLLTAVSFGIKELMLHKPK